MRIFLALVLALVAGAAQAQTPTCWSADLTGQGSKAAITINSKGLGAGWWCPDGTYWIYAVPWADMTDELGAAIAAARVAADPHAAFADLTRFATKTPADVFEVWSRIAAWKAFATEGQTIVVSKGPVVVRYGVDGHWLQKVVTTDGGVCSNEWFGSDPAKGLGKRCELAVLAGGPPPPQPPIYTHHVKALSGAQDRPVYAFSGGVRGTAAIPGVRATVGVGCKPEVAMAPSGASTTDLYAAYAPGFAASAVTLCVKVNP